MKPGPQFDRLYHGTVHDIPDAVQPPSATGQQRRNMRRGGMSRSGPLEVPGYEANEHASVSEREEPAWAFAHMSAERGGGRARVYEVGTAPDMKKGLEHSGNRKVRQETGFSAGGQAREWVSPTGFPVQGQIDIAPPESVRKPGKNMRYHPNPNGRQGTLPLDWTPHAGLIQGKYTPQSGYINHPTEREREMQARNVAPAPESFKNPPVYLGGQKLPDNFSEARRKKAVQQPMLPGMRGAVTRKGQ